MSIRDEYLPDETAPCVPRFDGPPLQLETRGVTQRLHQSLLWSGRTIHKATTAAKLRKAGRPDLAEKLERCHTIYTIAVCQQCGTVEKFPNRCDQFYCAECQPRLSHERRRAVTWWCQLTLQPKHVTLTVRNVPDLTTAHVQQLRRWFTNLRRSKFAKNWRGGFYCIETTNEGRGWHLHIHALVDARWIDAVGLSENWSRITNGMGRIVKVRDCRGNDYLKEVTKYACKGSQLAAWDPPTVRTFVESFTGVRTFGVFGCLYGARTQFAEWLKQLRGQRPACQCGSCDVRYFTEHDFLTLDLQPAPQQASIPPPPPIVHPEFALGFATRWPD